MVTTGKVKRDDFTSLRMELGQRGWYRKATGRVVLELALHLTVALSGIAVFIISDSIFVCGGAMLLSTAGAMGVATNSHTSSHYGTSDKKWVNEVLTYFGYPVFHGLSASYWRYMHVIRHHPAPNVVGMDMDHDLEPWFCIIEKQVQKTNGLRRFYYERIQSVAFPFALAVNGFSFQIAGWRYLLAVLRNPRQRKKTHWIDLGAMVTHWVIWLGAPMVFFPATDVVLFCLLRIGLLGYAMFVVLAPGHYPAEAVCLAKDHGEKDFVLRLTATTLNFRTGLLGRFICSGLEYQIEHHLFPRVSHVYYPKMSGLVEDFCRKNGYPYRTLSWGQAVWKSLNVFRTPKVVQPSLQRTEAKRAVLGRGDFQSDSNTRT